MSKLHFLKKEILSLLSFFFFFPYRNKNFENSQKQLQVHHWVTGTFGSKEAVNLLFLDSFINKNRKFQNLILLHL